MATTPHTIAACVDRGASHEALTKPIAATSTAAMPMKPVTMFAPESTTDTPMPAPASAKR